jgi:O-methyltransferase
MFYQPMSFPQLEKFDGAMQTFLDIYGRDKVFIADHLIAFDRNMTFAKDPKFATHFMDAAKRPTEKSLLWRLHILCWAARHARRIEGDFVECGVYEAFSSRVLTRYLEFEKLHKKLWLYDLFDHASETSGVELAGHGSSLADRVTADFSDYPNVNVIKGFIPHSFAQGLPDRIAWFHLDLNSATAETAALEVLFDRMSPGAVLILDDYGWAGYAEQKPAADKFVNARGHSILELPTGQGLLIKR